MLETIIAMTFIEKFFLTFALSGTVIFVIRMLLMIVGFASDHGDGLGLDNDTASDAHDIGFDHHDASMVNSDAHSMTDNATHHDDSDSSFRFISIQGITSFFMMFGWVGLAIIRDNQLPAWIAISGGIIAGVFTVWVLSRIFAFVFRLQSDGTMRIRHALGSGGTVYLNIPKEGTGQVQVEIDGRLKVCDAISSNKEEIKTGDQVTVVWVQSNGVLVVERDERTEGGKLCGL